MAKGLYLAVCWAELDIAKFYMMLGVTIRAKDTEITKRCRASVTEQMVHNEYSWLLVVATTLTCCATTFQKCISNLASAAYPGLVLRYVVSKHTSLRAKPPVVTGPGVRNIEIAPTLFTRPRVSSLVCHSSALPRAVGLDISMPFGGDEGLTAVFADVCNRFHRWMLKSLQSHMVAVTELSPRILGNLSTTAFAW